MNKRVIAFILVLIVGGGITAFVLYMKARTPKYEWDLNYSKKSDQPYGLKLFYELLKQENHVTSIGVESLDQLDTIKTTSNLIGIDSDIEYDSLSISFMLEFIKRGNNVFVSTDAAPRYLLERILFDSLDIEDYDLFESKAIEVNFRSPRVPYHEKLKFEHQYLKTVSPIKWSGYFSKYFDKTFNSPRVVPISYFNDTIINCFAVSYGKGALIVHANPILFTNYNMIQKSGFKQANNVFSYLNNGPVYWNEYEFQMDQNNGDSTNNPLKFLFSHYTLKTGWYVFLFSVFIFVLFRSKREQRIIPVIYKNKNTSIEYAKAIGALYYHRKSHHHIGVELYTIFMSDIRTRYHISTLLNEKELIDQLEMRAEVKKEILKELFQLFSDVRYSEYATSKELVKVYQAVENFNKIKK